MYVNNPIFGLKLIDFVDTLNNDNIDTDLINFTKDFLTPCKKYFYVNDDVLFNNFCELFALNFYSRTFNFDTTFELNMKLRNLLFLNQKKYQQIYKASLYDINPLSTYERNIKDEENKNGASESNNTSGTHTTSETKTNSESTGNGSNDVENYYSDGYENKTTVTMDYGTTTTDNNKHLVSNTPQSNQPVNDLFTSTKYVSAAENDNNTNVKSGRDTNTSTNEIKGHAYSDTTTNYTDATKSDSNNIGDTTTNGNVNNTFNDSREYKRIENGYTGNQMELLELFSKVVFDVHKVIIEDIENANLFSKYFL